jgi:DNA-binding TFAR19-related protein (PDSD5 family)
VPSALYAMHYNSPIIAREAPKKHPFEPTATGRCRVCFATKSEASAEVHEETSLLSETQRQRDAAEKSQSIAATLDDETKQRLERTRPIVDAFNAAIDNADTLDAAQKMRQLGEAIDATAATHVVRSASGKLHRARVGENGPETHPRCSVKTAEVIGPADEVDLSQFETIAQGVAV